MNFEKTKSRMLLTAEPGFSMTGIASQSVVDSLIHNRLSMPVCQKSPTYLQERQWHGGCFERSCVLCTLPTHRHYGNPNGANILIGTISVEKQRRSGGDSGKGRNPCLATTRKRYIPNLRIWRGGGGVPYSTGSILGRRV